VLPVEGTIAVRPEAAMGPLALSTGSLYTYGLARTFELTAEAVTVELGPEVLEAEDEGQVRAHLRQVVEFCREHGGERRQSVSGY
jgi:hypothetical protein